MPSFDFIADPLAEAPAQIAAETAAGMSPQGREEFDAMMRLHRAIRHFVSAHGVDGVQATLRALCAGAADVYETMGFPADAAKMAAAARGERGPGRFSDASAYHPYVMASDVASALHSAVEWIDEGKLVDAMHHLVIAHRKLETTRAAFAQFGHAAWRRGQ